MQTNQSVTRFLPPALTNRTGAASSPSNRIKFWLLAVLYLGLVAYFKDDVLTYSTIAYTVIVGLIFGFVIFKVYSFMGTAAAEIGVIEALSNRMSLVVQELKTMALDAVSSNGLDNIRAILARHHQSSQDALTSNLVWDTLLRYRSKTKLEINEIMSESTDSFFKGHQALLNTGASVAIAIGLLGTFAGMLHSVRGNITISNLLNGLNEAIGSSLIGVLSAIFIAAYAKFYFSIETDLRSALSRFALWGLFPPFQVETVITIDDKAAAAIGKKIGEALATPVGELTRGISDLTLKLSAHNKNLERLVDINQTFTEMHDMLTTLARTFSENSSTVATANEKLRHTLDTMNKVSTALHRDLQAWIEQNPALAIRDHVETIKHSTDGLHAIVSSLDKTVKDDIDKFIAQAAQYWQPLEKSMSSHFTILNGFVTKVGGTETHFADIAKHMNTIKNQLQELGVYLVTKERERLVEMEKKVLQSIQKNFNKEVKDWKFDVQQDRVVIERTNGRNSRSFSR